MPESDKLTASHLIFQLILSVHLMLSDIEVVSGVIVHRLHEAEKENIQDIVFQKNWGQLQMSDVWTKWHGAQTQSLYSHSQFIEEIRLQKRWERRGRRRVGRGWSSTGMLAALAQSQHMLEADVRLSAAVHTVGHAHGHWHQPSRSSRLARPPAGPAPQYVGQYGVPYVQGGIPGEAGQLLSIHLQDTDSQDQMVEEKKKKKREEGYIEFKEKWYREDNSVSRHLLK